jgi:hypothetical protein
MDDFQFLFTWNDLDYSAQAHVEGDTPRQTFTVTVDDDDLQDQYGETLTFTWIDQTTFSWDTPEAEGASDYMRAVNLGLMEYLDGDEDEEEEVEEDEEEEK